MPNRTRPYKYQLLTDYLAALPVATTTVTLTVAEIEAIVGFALPPGAYYHPFWGNSRQGTFWRRPWVRVGWWVMRAETRLAVPAITFARMAVPPRPPDR